MLINFDARPAENPLLSLEASPLAPGSYALEPLYGAPEAALAPLEIGAGGATAGYTPLPAIPPQTGYILRLAP